MKKYEKAMIVQVDELSEGIYMASGAVLPGYELENGTGDCRDCESQYMRGNRTKPKDWYLESDTMYDRGCEGCPYLYNPFGEHGDPLMPTWEREGYQPTDNYKYQ